jgi:hypothetical protein
LSVSALDGVIEGLEEVAAIYGDAVRLTLREVIDLLRATRMDVIDEPDPLVGRRAC